VKPEFCLTPVVYPNTARIIIPRITALASGAAALANKFDSAASVGIAISAVAVVGITTYGRLV
jgi:hypothetical protein